MHCNKYRYGDEGTMHIVCSLFLHQLKCGAMHRNLCAVYKTGALLFGAQIPERTIVVFGADLQKWPNVAAALQRGLVSDGPVTLVLERKEENNNPYR